MGKRKNYSGLSHFAKQAFSEGISLCFSELYRHLSAWTTGDGADKNKKTPREPKSLANASIGTGGATLDVQKQLSDVFALVPHYKSASEVPTHLQKYFSQRHRYFSLYDQGCLLDEEGWYSVTPERIASQIAERCRCDVILDAFCGVGGNAIAFAKTCHRVIAMDNSPTRLALARHNAIIYGVADRIEFVLADYIAFARSYLARWEATAAIRPIGPGANAKRRPIDIVFLSPPWGGPEYISRQLHDTSDISDSDVGAVDGTSNGIGNGYGNGTESHPEFSLAYIQPIHGADLFQLTRRITNNVVYFLPRNTNLEEISALIAPSMSTSSSSNMPVSAPVEDSAEMVEVEEEWMGSKLKALTCYFGGLVAGQERLF
ncbi:Tgs1 protein [Pisolithus marmoratus]|nr:Tgs1 protein [Pisolithus marmoratus]